MNRPLSISMKEAGIEKNHPRFYRYRAAATCIPLAPAPCALAVRARRLNSAKSGRRVRHQYLKV